MRSSMIIRPASRCYAFFYSFSLCFFLSSSISAQHDPDSAGVLTGNAGSSLSAQGRTDGVGALAANMSTTPTGTDQPETPGALIVNTDARRSMSLNGKWQYIVDPYETGFYDYRYKERRQKDPEAYWSSDQPRDKTDRKEHGFIDKYSLEVPGDWNSQDARFLYYEGTIWYKRTFDYTKWKPSDKLSIWFGAVNYRADIYLNGRKLGMHKGGFTPFNFEIPDSILQSTGNSLVVKVDNKRYADE
jgi:Glycosyl hydrolases family 2, sugar binding domain